MDNRLRPYFAGHKSLPVPLRNCVEERLSEIPIEASDTEDMVLFGFQMHVTGGGEMRVLPDNRNAHQLSVSWHLEWVDDELAAYREPLQSRLNLYTGLVMGCWVETMLQRHESLLSISDQPGWVMANLRTSKRGQVNQVVFPTEAQASEAGSEDLVSDRYLRGCVRTTGIREIAIGRTVPYTQWFHTVFRLKPKAVIR